MTILIEMIDKREIAKIALIPTERQIADALTKKGGSFIQNPKFLDLHLSLKNHLSNF